MSPCFRINCCLKIGSILSWFRQMVTSVMLQPGFIARPVFVVLGQVFLTSTWVYLVTIIPALLRTHSFIYYACCVMFFSQKFHFSLSVSFHHCSVIIHSSTNHAVKCFSPSTSVFRCQYHSTTAPYSFIHLPPTLYNVFSQYFNFPCHYHCTNAPYSSSSARWRIT
jgi:hypothetical protein